MGSGTLVTSSAVAILCALEHDGFDLAAGDGWLDVTPGARLTATQANHIRRYRDELIQLVRSCDPGVQSRRELFVSQLEAIPAPAVPACLVTPNLSYERARCYSCGAALGAPRFGRCELAWRLALRLPVLSDTDKARAA